MPEVLNYEMCDNILISLRKIVHAMGIHSRQLQRTYALTGPQLVLLREIFRTETISIGRLAQEVSLSNATVTGIIDRLEQLGYVSRARNGQDRRQVFLSCTDRGKKVLQEMPPLFQEHFISALSNLRDWEQGQMLAVVSRLAAMMGGNGSAGEDPAVTPALSEPDGFIDSCRMLLDNTVGAPWARSEAGYLDTLNSEAVAEFIRLTHERYWTEFGRWFGIFVGTVLKLTLAFAMIGIFALAWFTD